MKHRKRFMLTLLTFILLLSSFTFVYADDNSDPVITVDVDIIDNTNPDDRSKTVEEDVYCK